MEDIRRLLVELSKTKKACYEKMSYDAAELELLGEIRDLSEELEMERIKAELLENILYKKREQLYGLRP